MYGKTNLAKGLGLRLAQNLTWKHLAKLQFACYISFFNVYFIENPLNQGSIKCKSGAEVSTVLMPET